MIENHCPRHSGNCYKAETETTERAGAVSRVLALHGEDKEELDELMEDLKITQNPASLISDRLMPGQTGLWTCGHLLLHQSHLLSHLNK